MRGTFDVEEPSGDRWNVAVEQIAAGESFVAVGKRLLVYRDVHGPRATGHLTVEIRSTAAPAALTPDRASADIAAGIAERDEVLRDPRITQLANEHGVDCSYVYDYDDGRIVLASIADDGSVAWTSGSAP